MGPYVWESSAVGADLDGGSNEGIMQDFGLYESLLGAVSVSAGVTRASPLSVPSYVRLLLDGSSARAAVSSLARSSAT